MTKDKFFWFIHHWIIMDWCKNQLFYNEWKEDVWKARRIVGQSYKLKGGAHQPLQCSINVWESVDINVLSIPNNRIDTSNCGCFTTMQNGLPLSTRHKYLPRKILVRLVKNLWTKGCKGKLERWSDIILNWRGTCTPFSVWSMHGSGFHEPNWCTSNCGCFFRLDELTVRLVATVRWASILYRVWFQNKEWKRNDHWNLRLKLRAKHGSLDPQGERNAWG